MTRAQALSAAVARLREAGIDTPDRDARLLLQQTERIDSGALISEPEAPLGAPDAYDSAISRRCRREPVSKIVGYKDFWSNRFHVTPDVLDPRPDTETLIEAALDHAPKDAPLHIVDLGTGSGCILLTLLDERPAAIGIGLDVSPAALAVAKHNAEAMDLSNRAKFITSDWFSALDETFSLVVSNPPYISITEKATLAPEVTDWDPEAALFAGMDGLQAYRKIADGLDTVLAQDGTAIFEIGIGQVASVTAIFKEAGFTRISSRRDLGGIERCLVIQR